MTDLNFSYLRGSTIYRLNVFNVFDRENWVGGGSRNGNNPGNPRNFSASVTYRF